MGCYHRVVRLRVFYNNIQILLPLLTVIVFFGYAKVLTGLKLRVQHLECAKMSSSFFVPRGNAHRIELTFWLSDIGPIPDPITHMNIGSNFFSFSSLVGNMAIKFEAEHSLGNIVAELFYLFPDIPEKSIA